LSSTYSILLPADTTDLAVQVCGNSLLKTTRETWNCNK